MKHNRNEIDFRQLRESMVETQLIPRGIRDSRVLNAMRTIPRHIFIDESQWDNSYADTALPIGEGQTISQPYMVAIMTELLSLSGGEKVLEIGTGSGYQTALLAQLSGIVYTIERIRLLAERAQEKFLSLGYKNICVKVADGTIGWPDVSPFDRILVTAGAPELPEPLSEQLAEGGILLAPVGDRFSQRLVRAMKKGGQLSKEYHIPCVFVPLVGECGWKEADP